MQKHWRGIENREIAPSSNPASRTAVGTRSVNSKATNNSNFGPWRNEKIVSRVRHFGLAAEYWLCAVSWIYTKTAALWIELACQTMARLNGSWNEGWNAYIGRKFTGLQVSNYLLEYFVDYVALNGPTHLVILKVKPRKE